MKTTLLNQYDENMIQYFKIWFRLCFVMCFIFLRAYGESLLRKEQPLSIFNTFDPSIHSIYDAVDAWCTDLFNGDRSAEATYGHISDWNTTGITSMAGLFSSDRVSNCGTFNENINDWDVSSVTDMNNMFNGENFWDGYWVNPIFNQPLDSWDVSSVTNMGGMFKDAI